MRFFTFALRWLTPSWLDRAIARRLDRKADALAEELDGIQNLITEMKNEPGHGIARSCRPRD